MKLSASAAGSGTSRPIARGLLSSLKDDESTSDADDDRMATMVTRGMLQLGGGVGLSVVDDAATEVVYLSSRGIELHVLRDAQVETLQLLVQRFQLDQQMQQTPEHPVILLAAEGVMAVGEGAAATAGPGAGPNPVLKLVVERSRTVRGQATVFRLLDVGLGLVRVSLEELVLLKLLQLGRDATRGVLSAVGALDRPDDALFLPPAKSELARCMPPPIALATAGATLPRSGNTYFEELRVSELRFRVTVVQAGSLPPELAELKRALPPVLAFLGMDNVGINLDAFRLARPFVNQDQLFGFVAGHLRQGVLRHLPKIAGSLDILGNPYGLGKSMVSGVRAFLDESTRGAVLKGGLRMAQHMAQGFADSTSKMTKSISSKVSQVSMDRQFLQQRERGLAQGRQTGHLAAGMTQFTNGLASGIFGLVAQPIRGASTHGASGFLGGMMRGVLGVVVKPVTGVLDLAAETSAMVQEHTSDAGRNALLDRARLPRAIGPDHAVRSYNTDDAHGRNQLLQLNDCSYSERYVKRIHLGKSQQFTVLVTSERLLILEQTKGSGTPYVNMEIWFSGLFRSVDRDCAVVESTRG